jgi:hypothetical protein
MSLFSGVLAWVSRYQYLILLNDTVLDGLDPKYSYIVHIVRDIRSNSFRMDILLGCVTGLFWLKIFFLMRLTRTFGPMIKIIMSMVTDLATFAVIWSIQLFLFACVGVLLFGELKEY